MILIDTSVWIELLNGRIGHVFTGDRLVQVVTCGPIIQEVLQGFRQTPAIDPFRDTLLVMPRLSDPLPHNTFVHASDLYRQGRQKGYTIRSSTDCLIAAIAIENRVPIWHRDRDFDLIARYSSLLASQSLDQLIAR